MNQEDRQVWLIDPSNFTVPYDTHLADGLRANGWRPVLFGRRRRPNEDLLPAEEHFVSFFSRLSERVLSVRWLRRLGAPIKALEYLFDLIRLELAARRELPEIIHFQWMVLPMLERVFLRRLSRICPVLLTVHDTMPYLGSPTSSFQTLGWTGALNSADHLIVHLSASKRILVEAGIPEEKIAVISHGVMKFRGDGASRPAYVPRDRLIVLLLGHVKPYKGVDTLLNALAIMEPAVRRELCLVVAGKHAAGMRSTEDVAARMSLQDCVVVQDRFLPEEEMDALLRAADIVVFPYKMIDASGVFFSVAAYGKAVIATNVGVFSEVIKPNHNGLLITPGDSEALMKGLTELVVNRSRIEELAGNLVVTAKKSLSWQDIGARTGGVYDDVRS